MGRVIENIVLYLFCVFCPPMTVKMARMVYGMKDVPKELDLVTKQVAQLEETLRSANTIVNNLRSANAKGVRG